LGDAELTRWRALQQTDPALGNPFLAPEFTLAVGRARPGARVAVLEEGSQIVGFFPHEIRKKVIGKAIGAGISDWQGVVAAPDLEFDAQELIRACRLPVWEFDHLISGQRPFARFHAWREGSPVMDLSAGYEAYLSQRRAATSGSIKAALRKRRKLAREVGELRVVYDAQDDSLLATLMQWKSAQYRRTGMYDRFAIDWITQVVEELTASQAPGCAGTLCGLYAGDRLVAIDLGLRSESVLVDWFPAYNTEMARYSPGVLLALAMAEAAATAGIPTIDLGKGPAAFKDTLKTRELPVAVGRVVVSRPVAAARRVHLAAAGLARRGAAALRRG